MSRDQIQPRIAPGPSLPASIPNPTPAPRDYPRPAYSARFRCISSACEDTCCTGWSVPVDRVTYEKYRSIDELKPHLGTLIVLNTVASTPADFARIPLAANATCAFLDSEQLCGIQKKHGAENLSHTCATYPRALSTVSSQREEALNLSCPEAARLTLLTPNLIPDWTPSTSPRRYAVGAPSDPQLAIREFALSLVAERTYPLWQRMHLLGVLARRLESLSGARSVVDWADSNPAPVAQMLADSARVVTLQRLRPTMDGMHPDSAAQLQLVMELLRTRLAQPPVSPRFLECVQDFESGMGCCTATCEAEILSTYADALRLYYQPFMTRNPHILENYLANHIFKNHYPFTHPGDRNPDLQRDQPDAETEHLVLCVHLAIIQTILIGIAGHYRGAFAETHVVKLIQSFARTFEHSRESQDQFKTFLQTHNLKRLGGIALLLQVSPVLPNGVVAEVPGIAGPSVAVDGVECTRQSRAPRREWDHNTCCEAFSAEPQDVQGLTGGSE